MTLDHIHWQQGKMRESIVEEFHPDRLQPREGELSGH